MSKKLWIFQLLFSLVVIAGESGPSESKLPRAWSDRIDVSGSWGAGNTKSSDIRLGNGFKWENKKAKFSLDLRAERVQTFKRSASGSDPYHLSHQSSAVSSENYRLAANYNRTISQSLHWVADLAWRQDKLAGIKSRTGLSAGLGNSWVKTEKRTITTDYLISMITEDLVVHTDGANKSYPAVTFKLNHDEVTSKSTKYDQNFRLNWNTEELDDYLMHWQHNFTIDVSKRISFKLQLQLNYDNMPAFGKLPLFQGDPPEDTGEEVIVELEKLDSVFLVALTFKL